MAEQRSLTPTIDLEVTDQGFEEVIAFARELQATLTQTVWFQNVLTCLLSALVWEYKNLKAGLNESTLLVAWACRNMLELNIFTKFTLLKGSNARDFVDDMWIDVIEILSSFREWLRFHDPSAEALQLDGTIERLKLEKARQGVMRSRYLKVSEMAAAVGLSDEYQRFNKATSKLVHPTAFSVLGQVHEGELGVELGNVFFLAAIAYGLGAFNEIKDYVSKNGVEPLL